MVSVQYLADVHQAAMLWNATFGTGPGTDPVVDTTGFVLVDKQKVPARVINDPAGAISALQPLYDLINDPKAKATKALPRLQKALETNSWQKAALIEAAAKVERAAQRVEETTQAAVAAMRNRSLSNEEVLVVLRDQVNARAAQVAAIKKATAVGDNTNRATIRRRIARLELHIEHLAWTRSVAAAWLNVVEEPEYAAEFLLIQQAATLWHQSLHVVYRASSPYQVTIRKDGKVRVNGSHTVPDRVVSCPEDAVELFERYQELRKVSGDSHQIATEISRLRRALDTSCWGEEALAEVAAEAEKAQSRLRWVESEVETVRVSAAEGVDAASQVFLRWDNARRAAEAAQQRLSVMKRHYVPGSKDAVVAKLSALEDHQAAVANALHQVNAWLKD